MWRNVATLLSGNALSQLVNAATIIFVVSIYFPPDEFGRYAVLISYIGIVSVVACLRYDVGIVSVTTDAMARNLASMALLLATLTSVLCAVFLLAVDRTTAFSPLYDVPAWLFVATLFLKSIGQVFTGVLYRQERYFAFSSIRLAQAIVLLCGFLLAGVEARGTLGLMLAMLASYGAFAVLSGALTLPFFRGGRIGLRRMRVVATREADFVKFNSPQALIDTLLTNGVNIVINAFAGATLAGYYSYLQRAVRAPLALVFGALSQVVYRFCAKHAADPQAVQRELRRIALFAVALVIGGAVAAVLAYVGFDWLVFLRNWSGLRDHMLAFCAWLLVPFVFSPFATLPIVYQRQRSFFILATCFNLASLAALALLLWAGLRNGAFVLLAAAALVYFLAMSRWVYGLAGEARS